DTRRGLEIERGQSIVRLESVDQDTPNEPRATRNQDRFFRCCHDMLRASPARGKARLSAHSPRRLILGKWPAAPVAAMQPERWLAVNVPRAAHAHPRNTQ